MPHEQKLILEDGTEGYEIIEEEIAIFGEEEIFGEIGLIKQ